MRNKNLLLESLLQDGAYSNSGSQLILVQNLKNKVLTAQKKSIFRKSAAGRSIFKQWQSIKKVVKGGRGLLRLANE